MTPGRDTLAGDFQTLQAENVLGDFSILGRDNRNFFAFDVSSSVARHQLIAVKMNTFHCLQVQTDVAVKSIGTRIEH